MKFLKPFPVAALAEAGEPVKILGDPNRRVDGINEIHRVSEGDLSFVDHPKYIARVLASNASIIVLNSSEHAPPDGKTLVVASDPFAIYNALAKKGIEEWSAFYKANPPLVHPSAEIHPTAFIDHRVSIAEGCRIGAHVTILGPASIGKNTIIHPGTVIGADAFYFKKHQGEFIKWHSCGSVEIQDHVEIGSLCTIDKGVSDVTIVGEGTKLDNQIHIGHDTRIGKRCIIAAQTGIAGVTELGNDVVVWGKVGINKEVHIGDGAVILGQSGVTKSLSGGQTYAGYPAIEARKWWKKMASAGN